jgi:Heterokaryon incompatibility protein (HET)
MVRAEPSCCRNRFSAWRQHKFSVTPNLEAALRHLREEHFSKTMWVDALPLNQLDENEKAIQLELMSLIYASSSNTLIWLGPAYDESFLAMIFIYKTVVAMTKPVNSQPQLQSSDMRRDTFSRLDSPFDPAPLVAVSCFLRRPWFERMWV